MALTPAPGKDRIYAVNLDPEAPKRNTIAFPCLGDERRPKVCASVIYFYPVCMLILDTGPVIKADYNPESTHGDVRGCSIGYHDSIGLNLITRCPSISLGCIHF